MHNILHDSMQLYSFAGALLILAYVALFPFKLGFVVLEFTWALISFWSIFRNATLSWKDHR